MQLPYFPSTKLKIIHIKSDYYITGFTIYLVACCLLSNSEGITSIQNLWGFLVWVCLAILLRGESANVKIQVLIAIVFATIGEYFASVYMGVYLYQSGTVPAYVPPGHGMVYLTAVALGRSGLFQQYARVIAVFVAIVGSLWAIWGISSLSHQLDITGAILFMIFLLWVVKGRYPMVYLGAFFITTWLELVGTTVGNWTWVVIDPISGLHQGNPPSGVATYYCLIDAISMALTPWILSILMRIKYCRDRI